MPAVLLVMLSGISCCVRSQLVPNPTYTSHVVLPSTDSASHVFLVFSPAVSLYTQPDHLLLSAGEVPEGCCAPDAYCYDAQPEWSAYR